MRETRAQLQAEIERLEGIVDTVNDEYAALCSLTDTLRDENWDLREQLDARIDEITTMRGDLTAARAARNVAAKQMGSLAIEAGEAKRRCDTYLRIIDNQLAQIEQLENSL